MRRLLFVILVLSFIFLLVLSCSKDQPTGPVVPGLANVLILEDDLTEDTLLKILDSANFDVTMGGLFFDYTGTNFGAYDLVILLNGYEYDHVIADSIQTALRNYVFNGGVLLSTEWLLFTDYDTILNALLPVSYNNTFTYLPQTFLKVTNHAIAAGVPDSFDTRNGWSFSHTTDNVTSLSTNREVIYNGKTGGPALAIGIYGDGRSIHWSMAGQSNGPNIWSPEVRRLFINIAAFSKTI